jgi:hypothetical protein
MKRKEAMHAAAKITQGRRPSLAKRVGNVLNVLYEVVKNT